MKGGESEFTHPISDMKGGESEFTHPISEITDEDETGEAERAFLFAVKKSLV